MDSLSLWYSLCTNTQSTPRPVLPPTKLFTILAGEFHRMSFSSFVFSTQPTSDRIAKSPRHYAKRNLIDSNLLSTRSLIEGRHSQCSTRYWTKPRVSTQTMSKAAHSSVVPTPSLQARFTHRSLHKSEIFTLQWRRGQIWENTNSSLRGGNNVAFSAFLFPTNLLEAGSILLKTRHSIASISIEMPRFSMTRSVHTNNDNNLFNVISFSFKSIVASTCGRPRKGGA